MGLCLAAMLIADARGFMAPASYPSAAGRALLPKQVWGVVSGARPCVSASKPAAHRSSSIRKLPGGPWAAIAQELGVKHLDRVTVHYLGTLDNGDHPSRHPLTPV